MKASLLSGLALAVYQAHAHGSHGTEEESKDKSYMQRHMESEHHITDFDALSFFNLHDLNRDGILDHEELAAIYGVHHETSRQHTPDDEAHAQKTEEILSQVYKAVDFNKDGVVTKGEFLAAVDRGGLPNFEGIKGLGHHYDEEGEYFLHHEELYHSTPESQTEEAYNHPEDIAHFAHHVRLSFTSLLSDLNKLTTRTKDEIEAREHELDMKAQGLDVDGNPLPPPPPAEQQVLGDYADWSAEASRRGAWSGFKKPKDKADRLRLGVPWKFRTRGSMFGDVR